MEGQISFSGFLASDLAVIVSVGSIGWLTPCRAFNVGVVFFEMGLVLLNGFIIKLYY